MVARAIELSLDVDQFNDLPVASKISVLGKLVEAEQKRVEAEQKLQEEQLKGVEAEQKLQEEQLKGVEAEQKRQEEQLKRVEAEQKHVEAEQKRQEEQLKRVEQKRQEAEQKRQEAEQKRQEAEQKRQEAEQKRQEAEQKLEEERKETRNVRTATIEATYGNSKGSFKHPPLQHNKVVQPSSSGHRRTVTIKDDEGNAKKVSLKIPTAKIYTPDGDRTMWVTPSEVVIPVKDREGGLISSLLGAKSSQIRRQAFRYANEFGIQELCKNMIDDALAALGLADRYVKSHLEISIYMMKPDIMIVLEFEGRVMFVVEVKSPAHKETEGDIDIVFDSEHVGGQIWSYLYAMKASGVEVPMGAIMTYEKIALVTLDDLSGIQGHGDLLAQTKEVLKTGEQPVHVISQEHKACTERTSSDESPVKKGRNLACISVEHKNAMTATSSGNDGDSGENLVKYEQLDREVFRSKVYEKEEVFPCLLQALYIAFYNAKKLPSREVTVLSRGDGFGERLVFMVGPDSFDWVGIANTIGKGNSPVRAHIDKKVPNERTKMFFILDKLGAGQTAATYLACNRGGRVCAIKEYYLRPSFAGTDGEREKEEDRKRDSLYETARKEQQRWDELYKDRGFSTRVTYLGGKPCLLLPYGHEIMGEASNRFQHVPAIRDELERFAGKGFAYKGCDVRWRHVLLDMEKEVFLCDLESLEERDMSGDVVYEQVLSLLKVASAEVLVIQRMMDLATTDGFFDDMEKTIKGTDALNNFFCGLKLGNIQDYLKSVFGGQQSHLSAKAEATLYMLAHFSKNTAAKEVPVEKSRRARSRKRKADDAEI